MTDTEPLVVVVDDDPSLCRALGRLLRSAGRQPVTFTSAEAFLATADLDRAACLVLDVGIPDLNGLDLQSTLNDRGVRVPIVFLTGCGDIPMSVQAMKAGAVDFLTKPVDGAKLLSAVDQATARSARNRQLRAETESLCRRTEALSPREAEVMMLVADGLLNKQIAQRLGVTEKTVKVHRSRVMHKMGADSLAELVRMVTRLSAETVPSGALDQRPIFFPVSVG
jgi:FixJ family two-component response regulator